jgi:phage shock protein E
MIQFLKNLFGFGPGVNFEEIIANGALIIDVRTKGEYQNGHLTNAVNIPLDELPKNLSKLDKTKPIITCCASGMRSSNAESLLKSYGFADVYNGGSWLNLKKFEV